MLQIGQPAFELRQRWENYFFRYHCPDRLWGPPSLLQKWYRGAISPVKEQSGPEAENSHTSSAGIKNGWNYTSTYIALREHDSAVTIHLFRYRNFRMEKTTGSTQKSQNGYTTPRGDVCHFSSCGQKHCAKSFVMADGVPQCNGKLKLLKSVFWRQQP
jgi:hypothetical protein